MKRAHVITRCADCGDKQVPLKWYNFWEVWLCHECKEGRIRWFMGDQDGPG
jgi:hypothetical protein